MVTTSLAAKLALRIGGLLLGLVIVVGTALWGLFGLRTHHAAVEHGHQQLRDVYEIGHRAAAARMLVRADDASGAGAPERVRQLLAEAAQRTDRLLSRPVGHGGVAPDHHAIVRRMRGQLRRASRAAGMGRGGVEELNAALGQVATVARRINRRVLDNRRAAAAELRATIGLLGALGGLVLIGGAWLGWRQYRGVVRPLRELGRGVDRAAAADFAEGVPRTGDRELVELADRFNRMAAELDGLYRRLEERVTAKSRQLIRSERLASVGQLAAGLAHEINNPLSIIGGYAERGRRALPAPTDASPAEAPGTERARHALQVIEEETFRCKGVTDQLLELARPGSGEREDVDIDAVASRTVTLLAHVPKYRDRRLSHVPSDEPVAVAANRGELTQVLLNIVGNALEATEPETGRVTLETGRRGAWGWMRITDNGRGMTPEQRERVFEPFATSRGPGEPSGTGLGLSVAEAIVSRHGGRIRAESAGCGAGSVFVVELPTAEAHASASAGNEGRPGDG